VQRSSAAMAPSITLARHRAAMASSPNNEIQFMRILLIASARVSCQAGGLSTACQQKSDHRTDGQSSTGHAPGFIMGITVCHAGSLFGLPSGILCSLYRSVTYGMQAVIQALAQNFDLWHAVQIAIGKQPAQIRDQFFQFALRG